MSKTLFFLWYSLDDLAFFCYNMSMSDFSNEQDFIVLKDLTFHKSNRFFAKVIDEDDPEEKYVSHAHKHYELFQLLEGDISWIIDSKIYRLIPGDVILIRPNDFHILKIHGKVYARRVMEFQPTCLQMTQGASDWFLAPFHSEQKVFNNLIPKNLIDNSSFNVLFDKLETLITDTQTPTETRIMTASVLMAELLLCIRNLMTNNLLVKNYVSPICQSIINYINKNINKRILLSDMEKDLHLSRFYLSHEFKKHMGISISSYIIEKKIFYAEQLIESGISPTEASFAVAYDYPNFFVNYKKILHKTPKQSIQKT